MTDVTTEKRINSLSAMAECNGDLMTEVYNDGQLNAMEKMKGFSMGVRNAIGIRRSQLDTIKMLSRAGLKPDDSQDKLSLPNMQGK